MEESGVFERPTQEQIAVDLREMFRGAIRLTLEMLLAEVVKEMLGRGDMSESAVLRTGATAPTSDGC